MVPNISYANYVHPVSTWVWHLTVHVIEAYKVTAMESSSVSECSGTMETVKTEDGSHKDGSVKYQSLDFLAVEPVVMKPAARKPTATKPAVMKPTAAKPPRCQLGVHQNQRFKPQSCYWYIVFGSTSISININYKFWKWIYFLDLLTMSLIHTSLMI